MFEDTTIALGQPCGIHSQEDAPVPAGSAEVKPSAACRKAVSSARLPVNSAITPVRCNALSKRLRICSSSAASPEGLSTASSIKFLYDMDEPTKPAGMLSIKRLAWVLACSIMLYS